MKNFNLILILCSLFLTASCYKEEAIVPSTKDEPVLGYKQMLLQGTQIHNNLLTDYFKRYDIVTFYEFSELDYAYEVTGTALFNVKAAEEPYVDELLNLIDKAFYKTIGEKAILAYMPRKVLLASELRQSGGQGLLKDSYFGYSSFIVMGANEAILSYDAKRINEFKSDITSEFIYKVYKKGGIKISAAFATITDYDLKVTEENYMEFGYIRPGGTTLDSDFRNFVEVILSKTTAELYAPDGELNPNFDKNGLILKKYEILVKELKKYHIDLQKIADYVVTL